MSENIDLEIESAAYEIRIADHPSFGGLAEQHVAAEHLDTVLDEDDDVHHASSADWADIEEDGIHYGLRLEVDALGQIAAGLLGDRFEDEYREAVHEAEPEYSIELRDFLREEYGAVLRDDVDRFDDVEFLVEYEEGGARASTIEYMGQRADQETGLLRARNEATNGVMLDKFAARLGYSRGPWVKTL
jgi:hypothetical protein